MKKAMFALSALTFILAGCDTAEKAATQAESQPAVDTLPTAVSNAVSTVTDTVSAAAGTVAETVDAGHNAFNSLDWQGTYKGTLPCADCAGIDYTLTLNEDETYTLTQVYQGKEDSGQFSSNGKFHWDTKGSVITLEDGSETPNQYFVGENMLMKLDINGEKITGDMAALYNLQKQ
ncbi:copper resistance protein NlpE [Vibrio fluvialis]|nr:copper resistance protein NlpE N-terminal domain-containing protein [Vibrio fluvialis]ELG2041445.1 copper resistance protein NlpE N-terminal domain-containing protein [Vibrio fluvialis]MBY7888231.1 copper resistance protein NlpE [Vibrio fluvialis]